jgi:hypothetical protein
MTNLNTLFDLSKYEKRKSSEQQEFESKNRDLLIFFKSCVPLCLKMVHKKVLSVIEPIDQDKNLRAVVMSGLLKGQFLRKYPHYCHKATKQRFKLFVNGESIYLKKLDNNFMPSNILTKESFLIFNQLSSSNTDLGTNIFLGYVVEDDWSKIIGIYAVCIDGDKLLWYSDLKNFGEAELPPVVTIKPKPIAPRVKQGAKKRKPQTE